MQLVPLHRGETGLIFTLQIVEVVRDSSHPAWHLPAREPAPVRVVLSDGERTISMMIGSKHAFLANLSTPENEDFLKKHAIIELKEYRRVQSGSPRRGEILVLEDYGIKTVPTDGKIIGLPGGGLPVPVEREEAPVAVAPEPEAMLAGVRQGLTIVHFISLN
jgi:hypothetical protein